MKHFKVGLITPDDLNSFLPFLLNYDLILYVYLSVVGYSHHWEGSGWTMRWESRAFSSHQLAICYSEH